MTHKKKAHNRAPSCLSCGENLPRSEDEGRAGNLGQRVKKVLSPERCRKRNSRQPPVMKSAGSTLRPGAQRYSRAP